MKKIAFVFSAVLLSFTLIAPTIYADSIHFFITPVEGNPPIITTNEGFRIGRYANNTSYFYGYIYAPSGLAFNLVTPAIAEGGTYRYIAFDNLSDTICDSLDYNACLIASENIVGYGSWARSGEEPYTWLITAVYEEPEEPEEPETTFGLHFFGGAGAPPELTYTANDMVASVASAIGVTIESVGPILAVVIGLLLALVLGKKIINMFYIAPVIGKGKKHDIS